MVQLVFTPETLENCIKQILKHSEWRSETFYLKTGFFSNGQITIGQVVFSIGKVGDAWYLKNKACEYCKIPYFMASSLKNTNRFTFWLGPYAFVNEFELTKEGQYLIKMLEHPCLSTAAQRKVDEILTAYRYWVQVDEQFMEILKKRDQEVRHNG